MIKFVRLKALTTRLCKFLFRIIEKASYYNKVGGFFMKVYVTRWTMTHAEENTMDSILLAVHSNVVDGVIVDLRLTKDEEVVLMKDETVDRTTQGKGKVRDMTLDEITRLKMGNKVRHFFVPSLDFLLSRYQSPKQLVLFLQDEKERNSILVEKVISIVDQYPDINVEFLTDSYEILNLLNETKCERERGMVVANAPFPDILKVNYFVVGIDYINQNQCQQMMDGGNRVATFLIDTESQWNQLVETLGSAMVDQVSVITQYPNRIAKFRQNL